MQQNSNSRPKRGVRYELYFYCNHNNSNDSSLGIYFQEESEKDQSLKIFNFWN